MKTLACFEYNQTAPSSVPTFMCVSGHPGMGPMQRMGHPGGRMPGPMNPYDSLQNYSMGPRGPPPNTNMGPGPGGMPPMSMSVQPSFFFRFF